MQAPRSQPRPTESGVYISLRHGHINLLRSAGTGEGSPHKANGRETRTGTGQPVSDGQPEGGHCPGEVYGEKSRGPGAEAGPAPKHK